MRKTVLVLTSFAFLLLAGCSTDESTRNLSSDTNSADTSSPPITEQLPELVELQGIPENLLISNDSLTAVQLERARQHYLSAMRAEETGDSGRASRQFERAIEILDELSYYPEIESNQDFTDLSKTIVEDYEKFLSKSGVVDSTLSVFALREKLNLLSDQLDTTSVQPERIIVGTSVPLVVNNLVQKHIQFFTNRGRHHMERWLERSGKYFPMIHKIFREEGVPEEMAYLAMIESGLNPVARSWAKALGMWQFIKGTGVRYGLAGNFWYDDRRDFEKATRAAAQHLRDLYADFDDWYLVMSAYNAGAGRVYRAMRRSGSKDFWEMRRFLPRETRSYVPSYIAVSVIAMNHKEYGFDVTPADPLDYDYVTVDDCVDLEVLAECAGIEFETLRELNPMLIHRSTPPTVKGFQLRVPRSVDKELFQQNYASLPESKKMSWVTHRVKKGETIQSVARHYGVSHQVLAESNGLKARSRLKVGGSVMIPVSRERTDIASNLPSSMMYDPVEPKAVVRNQSRTVRSAPAAPEIPADKTRLTYRVKSGDTIGHIAEWYGVRATDIRTWNNLPYNRSIQIGQRLAIWVDKSDAAKLASLDAMTPNQKKPQPKKSVTTAESAADASGVYVVKSGDSLDKIAREHGVTVQQIQRWNSLRSSRIMPGDELVVYPVVKEVESARAKSLADARATSAGKSKHIIYVVRKGDTVWQIAQQYDVQESQIREWNSLNRSGRIYAGQELIIKKETN